MVYYICIVFTSPCKKFSNYSYIISAEAFQFNAYHFQCLAVLVELVMILAVFPVIGVESHTPAILAIQSLSPEEIPELQPSIKNDTHRTENLLLQWMLLHVERSSISFLDNSVANIIKINEIIMIMSITGQTEHPVCWRHSLTRNYRDLVFQYL